MDKLVHSILDVTVGNLFGKDITCKEPIHPWATYQPGALVEIGRTSVNFIKKFLMPCGLCAAVPAIRPAHPPQDCPVDCNNEIGNKKLIRPSELPIYTFEDDNFKQTRKDYTPSTIEHGISQIRMALQEWIKEYESLTSTITSKIDTGIAHSHASLDYLREESNILPRAGAIGIGGLTGLIFGLRGGKFKRLLYTSTGVLTTAAVCYPAKAQESLVVAKHYVNIGYNFIYGVKPGDSNQLDLSLPDLPSLKVPTNFSEIKKLATDTGSFLASTVGSLTDKVLQAVTQQKEENSSASSSKEK